MDENALKGRFLVDYLSSSETLVLVQPLESCIRPLHFKAREAHLSGSGPDDEEYWESEEMLDHAGGATGLCIMD